MDWRWDFGVALEYIRRGARVLDVGCGPGTFIQRVQERGGCPVGIDLNEQGLALARERGLDVHRAELKEFVAAHPGEFDVVTIFQVLEHVEDAQEFATTARLALRPGGLLIISVPDRHRRCHAPFEPLECPPHHLSHWSDAQIEALSIALGMRCREMAHQTLDAGQFASFVAAEMVTPHLAGAPKLVASAARFVTRGACRVVYEPLLRTGWLARRGFVHHSLLGVLATPGPS
jgi:SAM-dependent methyltransferase